MGVSFDDRPQPQEVDMSEKRLSEFPVSHLRTLRDVADKNTKDVLASWQNPELSKEDMDTLKLVSLILAVISPQLQ
jgi:hypothetical protein